MKALAIGVVASGLASCAEPQQASAQQITAEAGMEISRTDTRQATPGPLANFTGAVAVTPLFGTNEASAVSAGLVRFQPGARSAWHTHPKGQRLVVTEGSGWTQVDGGSVQRINAGDVVWCPPGVRHWHGATSTTAMSHIAVQESVNGSPVSWMEHVKDEDYSKGPTDADA